MPSTQLTEVFLNLAAPQKVQRPDPIAFAGTGTSPLVINGPEVQQNYGPVLSDLHKRLDLPNGISVSILTRDDLELIYGKPLPYSYNSMTDPDIKKDLRKAMLEYYKTQGIDIKNTPVTQRSLDGILRDIISNEATSSLPSIDMPLCVISFDATGGKLKLIDSFLSTAGIKDPEGRIKLNPMRLEGSFTLVHEAAHCNQVNPTGSAEISLQMERESDAQSYKTDPAETSLFYRARIISGIHKTSVRTLIFPDDKEVIDHATEIDLLDQKKFPEVTSVQLMNAYAEIGTALTSHRMMSGAFNTQEIREGLLPRLDLVLYEEENPSVKQLVQTIRDELAMSQKPLSEIFKDLRVHEKTATSEAERDAFFQAKGYVMELALKLDPKSPFIGTEHTHAETTLGDTAPLVAKMLDGADGQKFSPLAQHLMIIYTNAAADVQPDVEPYRRPLPLDTRNPFTEDISAFMIQPPPTQQAHVNKTKLPKKVSPQKKSPAAQ